MGVSYYYAPRKCSQKNLVTTSPVLSFIHPSQFCSSYISATTCLNSMKLYGKFYENNKMSLLSTHCIAMIFHGVIALWFSYTSFCVPIIAPGEHPLVSSISCFSRHKIYKVHTLSPQTWQFTNKSTEYCIPQKNDSHEK